MIAEPSRHPDDKFPDRIRAAFAVLRYGDGTHTLIVAPELAELRRNMLIFLRSDINESLLNHEADTPYLNREKWLEQCPPYDVDLADDEAVNRWLCLYQERPPHVNDIDIVISDEDDVLFCHRADEKDDHES